MSNSSIWPIVIAFWARVKLGVIAKKYSAFFKAPDYLVLIQDTRWRKGLLQKCSRCILQSQLTGPVINRTLVGGVSYPSAEKLSVYSTAIANWASHIRTLVWGMSYPSAEKQSVYSTAIADWVSHIQDTHGESYPSTEMQPVYSTGDWAAFSRALVRKRTYLLDWNSSQQKEF